jgi:PHS family inorganic phosphate transporter-like MFS transporter
MQGIGNLLACLVMFILLSSDVSQDLTWRLGLALGAVPAALAFYFRFKSHETEDFIAVKRARTSHWINIRSALRVYWWPLIGTAGTWLILDITFYGNGLFSGTITELMHLGSTPRDAALNSLYIALIALPGYFFSIAFMDRIGRKTLQWAASFVLFSLYLILGLAFNSLVELPALFLILYGLTFFFSNFGANTTTYIIPGEFFPAEVRATCHGISAASGKVGAAIASYAFPPLKSSVGVATLLAGCGIVALVGSIWTLVFVPDYAPDQQGPLQAYLERYHAEIERSLSEAGLPSATEDTGLLLKDDGASKTVHTTSESVA